MLPYFKNFEERAKVAQCSKKLQGLGAAMILYAEDHGYFPHVKAAREQHDSEDISRAYRALIYHGYLNDPGFFICPASGDCAAVFDKSRDRPQSFNWQVDLLHKDAPNPLSKEAEDPDFVNNHHLSYSYLRRPLKYHAGLSNRVLAVDKGLRGDEHWGAEDQPRDLWGNHPRGFNVLYSDGKVRFVSIYDPIYDRLVCRLYMFHLLPTDCSGETEAWECCCGQHPGG